jgi:hypothetical protein
MKLNAKSAIAAVLFLTAATSAFTASAQQAARTAPGTAITIYNQNTALIEDTRAMDIRTGRQRIEFPGVSAQIRPETVTLTGDGLGIIEQNFDFDLLTPFKMMEKAVGSTVRIVRTNPATGVETTETAEILSANQGIVMRIGNRIEVLRDDGLPVRVLFDRIPENLRARPTLSVTVESGRAGNRPVTIRYLSGGLNWKADYVALFDEANSRIDVQGWVTLTNQSGASYTNARTQLIAGSPGGGAVDTWRQQRGIAGVRNAGTGGRGSADTEFGDFHLYTLAEPTTIAENQTKQVSFLDANGVAARKVYYIADSGWTSREEPQNVESRLMFSNSGAGGMGEPLPAGTVRIYQRDRNGRAQFIGEDNLGHTPEGSSIDLKIGDAFDVTAQSTVVNRTSPVRGVSVTQMSYRFANAKSTPVTIIYRAQGLNDTRTWEASSIAPRRIDANSEQFEVTVPANGETVLTFTIREGTPEPANRNGR